jgi:hypothetical protein
MVKDSITRSKLPRAKPKLPPSADARAHRHMMRMHPHLTELLDVRAAEREETRSRFIEKILVAYLRADPRNPRIDGAGRIVADAPPPLSVAVDPIKFGEKWATWKRLNDELFGIRLSDDLVEDQGGYAVWLHHTDREDLNK